jgi:hypothetical protein
MPVIEFAKGQRVKIVGRGCADLGRSGVVTSSTNIGGTTYYFVDFRGLDFRGLLRTRHGRFLAADLELAG